MPPPDACPWALVHYLQMTLKCCQPLATVLSILHHHTFMIYFAYAYIAPAQPALQGIDSSSSASNIAYSRLAWQQLVGCHSGLSNDPSLVSRKALMRWPPTASAFVVSFETLEVEGRQSGEGGRSHLMELLKECMRSSLFSRKRTYLACYGRQHLLRQGCGGRCGCDATALRTSKG